MRVAFITRSNLLRYRGGDTVQAEQTAASLRMAGVEADIIMTDSEIEYDQYDLLHFFNLVRPSDMLKHIRKAKKQYVVSPVFVDYSHYDRYVRRGISGWILRHQSPAANEYLKTILRWIRGNDKLVSPEFLWKGQTRSMRSVIRGASMLLPNSRMEKEAIRKFYGNDFPARIVPNGIDGNRFPYQGGERDEKLVISVARIEGVKNQLNLIRALNNTPFKLVLIGEASPNQSDYFNACQREAASNIEFTGYLPQEEIVSWYRKAKVHVLPSWFETCGLSSLEAGASGCQPVITDRGFTRDYFGADALYCDPGNPASIRLAVEKAAAVSENRFLSDRIHSQFTWKAAATETIAAYQQIIQR